MHDSTADLVNGNITIEEWLKGADAARDKALTPTEQEIYGTAEETLTPLQTAYVNGLAYLNSMDADIAYVPVAPSYGTQSYFYSGSITDDTIGLITTETSYYITANEKENLKYVVVEMTGQELLDQVISWCDHGMAAFAGAEMTYSLSKADGSQYISVKIDGEEMDMDQTYRVASLRGAVPQAKVIKEYPDLTFRDLFRSYLKACGGTVTAPPQLVIVD